MPGVAEEKAALERFRAQPKLFRFVLGRPRTFIALGLGLLGFVLLPATLRPITRALVAWDLFATFYLALVYVTTLRSGVDHIRRNAARQDDGRFLILIITALGAFASIAAIVSELGVKDRGGFELGLAVLTIALTWACVHTTFALHYAHEFYRDDGSPGGLEFPGRDDDKDEPDYWDFVYFSFVVGMTAQTADVGISDRMIRRTVTVHGLIAFVFNTALVALIVNIAAGAISGN